MHARLSLPRIWNYPPPIRRSTTLAGICGSETVEYKYSSCFCPTCTWWGRLSTYPCRPTCWFLYSSAWQQYQGRGSLLWYSCSGQCFKSVAMKDRIWSMWCMMGWFVYYVVAVVIIIVVVYRGWYYRVLLLFLSIVFNSVRISSWLRYVNVSFAIQRHWVSSSC